MDLGQSLDINELNKWYGRIDKLVKQWNGFYPDAQLELINDPKALTLKIYSPFFKRPCVTIGKDYGAEFEQIFRHILEWENVFRRKNPKSKFFQFDLEVTIHGNLNGDDKVWNTIPWENKPVVFELENIPDINSLIKVQIQPRTDQPQYVSALVLTESNYSITNQFLPYQELENDSSYWLQTEKKGLIDNVLPINLENLAKGATEENILIKLFITNDDKLNTDFFSKGKPDLAAFRTNKVEATATLEEEFELDWRVIDIPIKFKTNKNDIDSVGFEAWKINLRALTTQGDIENIIAILVKNIKENSRYYDSVMIQKASYRNNMNKKRLGVVSEPDLFEEETLIRRDIIKIIERVELSDLKSNSSQNPSFLKIQNLLLHLATYDILKVSTEEVPHTEGKLSEFKKELKGLINQNNTKKAVELLLASLNKDARHYNHTIFQGAIFNENEDNKERGIIRDEDYSAKKRETIRSILEIIYVLEIEEIQPGSDQITPSFLLKEELKDLLYNREIELSLNLLRESLKKSIPLFKSTMVAMAAFEKNENNMRLGLISQQDYSANKEKIIIEALINIDTITLGDLNENYNKDSIEDEVTSASILSEDSNTEVQSFKEKIKYLISERKTESAIELLISSLNKQTGHYQKALLQRLQLQLLGSQGTDQAKLNLIVSNILSILEEIKASDLKPNVLEDIEKNDFTTTPPQETKQQTNISQEAPNIIISETNIQDYTPKEIGETGHFTDPRDGQRYKTVMLKDRKIWMAQNLNFEVPPMYKGGSLKRLKGRREQLSWFYDDNPENGKIYGCLYTWDGALAACPLGWHVPSDDEWWAMAELYGKIYNDMSGKSLNTGTDTGKKIYRDLMLKNNTGFDVQLGGYRNSQSYKKIDEDAIYWSSTEFYGNTSTAMEYAFKSKQKFRRSYNVKNMGFSCRCVKD